MSVPLLSLAPLKNISPSRFSGMRKCPLREVWTAAKTTELLPSSPFRFVGRIAHKLQEEASLAGKPLPLETRFDEIVRDTEAVLEQDEFNNRWVPLSEHTPGFLDLRRRALEKAKHAESSTQSSTGPSGGGGRRRLGPEVRVRARAGLIVGSIDCVVLENDKLVIYDEKLAEVRGAEGGRSTVKSEYEVQLKMYAAMYAEDTEISYGNWPDELILRPLYGPKLSVPYLNAECTALLDQAVDVLEEVNSIIESNDVYSAQKLLADARPENCYLCNYRPGCAAYRPFMSLNREDWPRRDIRGKLLEATWKGNGTLSLSVAIDDLIFRIRGIRPEIIDSGISSKLEEGKDIEIYSLRGTRSESTFEAGRFTVLVVCDSA